MVYMDEWEQNRLFDLKNTYFTEIEVPYPLMLQILKRANITWAEFINLKIPSEKEFEDLKRQR